MSPNSTTSHLRSEDVGEEEEEVEVEAKGEEVEKEGLGVADENSTRLLTPNSKLGDEGVIPSVTRSDVY